VAPVDAPGRTDALRTPRLLKLATLGSILLKGWLKKAFGGRGLLRCEAADCGRGEAAM
jgi:hypothetical protein